MTNSIINLVAQKLTFKGPGGRMSRKSASRAIVNNLAALPSQTPSCVKFSKTCEISVPTDKEGILRQHLAERFPFLNTDELMEFFKNHVNLKNVPTEELLSSFNAIG